jgi:hypothetical protein
MVKIHGGSLCATATIMKERRIWKLSLGAAANRFWSGCGGGCVRFRFHGLIRAKSVPPMAERSELNDYDRLHHFISVASALRQT